MECIWKEEGAPDRGLKRQGLSPAHIAQGCPSPALHSPEVKGFVQHTSAKVLYLCGVRLCCRQIYPRPAKNYWTKAKPSRFSESLDRHPTFSFWVKEHKGDRQEKREGMSWLPGWGPNVLCTGNVGSGSSVSSGIRLSEPEPREQHVGWTPQWHGGWKTESDHWEHDHWVFSQSLCQEDPIHEFVEPLEPPCLYHRSCLLRMSFLLSR